MSNELLATARRLIEARPKRPSQSDLKRAISTAYYALFHAIARHGADALIGVGRLRKDGAWLQTYRALDHGPARNACEQLRGQGFPPHLCECGETFIQLQRAQHAADYDPSRRVSGADALAAITLAETAIAKLDTATRKDRRALAVQLLLKRR